MIINARDPRIGIERAVEGLGRGHLGHQADIGDRRARTVAEFAALGMTREQRFDRLEADLAKAMMSLPASKGFEIGSGFGGTELTGIEHNDEFYMDGPRVRTRTNRSGGVQGGISNGETIWFRVAFKPTATILPEQKTVNIRHEDTLLKGRGRHDPCVLPRAVVIVEAMASLVLVDHALRHAALMAGSG